GQAAHAQGTEVGVGGFLDHVQMAGPAPWTDRRRLVGGDPCRHPVQFLEERHLLFFLERGSNYSTKSYAPPRQGLWTMTLKPSSAAGGTKYAVNFSNSASLTSNCWEHRV